uniref:Uncharacterized protein n=1 Tax=Lactuca sativa TaxID=4236 RepID=A0A9R1V2N3_LACSA|nr:hypothetical protein LSAT_V11C700361940 [Lactuca sativa]
MFTRVFVIQKMLCSRPSICLAAHQVLCMMFTRSISNDEGDKGIFVFYIPLTLVLVPRPIQYTQNSFLLCFCEIGSHPWICENGVALDRALDPAVLSRLKQFSAMNKLKKMALRVHN